MLAATASNNGAPDNAAPPPGVAGGSAAAPPPSLLTQLRALAHTWTVQLVAWALCAVQPRARLGHVEGDGTAAQASAQTASRSRGR